MLGFGKNKKNKKSKKGKTDQEQIDPKLEEQIHIMPERFFIKPTKKRSSSTWFVVIGVFIIIVLGGVAFYLFFTLNQPTEEPQDQQEMVEDTTQSDEEVVVDDSDVSATTELEIFNPITDEEEAETTNEDSDSETIEAQDLAVDSDNDNLTLAEEILFLTDEFVADSDEDGFLDGTEVLNGYDPNVAGKTLIETDVFRQYSNDVYSIAHPKIWEFREQNLENTEVLFIADSGEFVEVLILPNVNLLSLEDWYTQQFPEFSSIAPIKIKINNSEGILHPNGRNYYLISQNNLSSIYIITYNVGEFIDLKYNTIFRSMVNSFRVKESL